MQRSLGGPDPLMLRSRSKHLCVYREQDTLQLLSGKRTMGAKAVDTTPNLASIGALIGHPTRAVMLEALIDGRDWTASELASQAGVTPQTASAHLRKLVEGGMLRMDSRGRHRHFSLTSTDVADALEALEVLATRRVVRPGLRSMQRGPLREGRTCYDHVAGRLGVTLVDSLVCKRYLEEGDDAYMVTAEGGRFMSELGVNIDAARQRRRSFARKCLDWSEERYHLGGALGAALAERLFDLDWLRRVPKSRIITVTPYGASNLRELGMVPD